MSDVWFHGGVPGLAVGDRILPPDITGTTRRLSKYLPHQALAAVTGIPYDRTDVVYLARYQQHARVYAAFWPDGALYQVEAATDTEPDPDAPGISVMAGSAVITAVLRPRVVLAHRRFESWMRMLTTTPEAPHG